MADFFKIPHACINMVAAIIMTNGNNLTAFIVLSSGL
jgi:hypothetical protein